MTEEDFKMKLAPESGNLFYQLWLPLLDFVNETYQVNPGLGRLAEADSMDPAEVKEMCIRDRYTVFLVTTFQREG